MPIPAQCQTIADQIAELEGERENLKGLAGAEKWAALQKNANLARQILKKQEELDRCIVTHTTGYATEVVVLDLTGSTVVPAEGRMWQLSAPGAQSTIETSSVANGRISFAHGGSISGKSIGISIEDAPNAIFTGPLFRSGPFTTLPPGSPADPAGLIEIGVPAAVQIPAATLSSRLPAPAAFSLPAGVSITSLALSLGSGTATITVNASMMVSLGFLGTITLPFTYALTFAIVPSFNMNVVTEVCLVVPSGPARMTTSLGGFLSFILGSLSPAFEPMLTGTVVPALQSAINGVLLSTAASVVSLPALPAGVVLSMRRVVITPAGVAMFPSIGAYGGLLNKLTFP
jgi:hypothetical protein